MVSCETGGRLSTCDVKTGKLLYTNTQQGDDEIQHFILHSNSQQVIVFSRPPKRCTTTCTCRSIESEEDVLYQFQYETLGGATCFKDGILTNDETGLIVASVVT